MTKLQQGSQLSKIAMNFPKVEKEIKDLETLINCLQVMKFAKTIMLSEHFSGNDKLEAKKDFEIHFEIYIKLKTNDIKNYFDTEPLIATNEDLDNYMVSQPRFANENEANRFDAKCKLDNINSLELLETEKL